MNENENYMKMALNIARRGMGFTLPNPMVGAVIVRAGQILGTGFHQKYGNPHAEVEAINDAEKNGHDVAGADLYCTLEPCSHFNKKTPPCAQMLVAKKLKRVFIATLDSNPEVSGNGVKILQDAGVEVHVGPCSEEALELNQIFFSHIKNKFPALNVKWGQSLDGFIALNNGVSKYITNSDSRVDVHHDRKLYQNILIGGETLRLDDPILDCRHFDLTYTPNRFVLTSLSKLTHTEYKLFQKERAHKTFVLTIKSTDPTYEQRKKELQNQGVNIFEYDKEGFSLKKMFQDLYNKGFASFYIEAGRTLLTSLLAEKIADQLTVYLGAKMLSCGKSPLVDQNFQSLEQAIDLNLVRIMQIGDDVKLTYKIK